LLSIYANKLYTLPLTVTSVARVLLALISISLTWEGNRFIILYFRGKFTGQYEMPKRISVVFATGILYTLLILTCTAFIRYFILYGADTAIEQMRNGDLLRNLLTNSFYNSLIAFCLFFVVYEALYFYGRFKQSEEEKMQLEKEKLWSQLGKLNQEVNPHFLFNTLNSLSSLITEDPAEADRFLNEMSKVYRYLLDNNRHELVTLQTELKFIQSFYQLLKLRFNKGIELSLQTNPKYEDYLLPPLSLQLLVENAVKHNTTSKDQPLQIFIEVTDMGRLTVKNNLQRKKEKPVSHKIGLSNISEKYRLMQQDEVVIKEESGYFLVSLPLIHPSVNKSVIYPAN